MGHLVGGDSGDLCAVHLLQQAGAEGYQRALAAGAGCKGVDFVALVDADLDRLRQAGAQA